MDKLKMQTVNKADENYKKLAEMFPNAVTEAIDENGEVVRAIDKDVLMQEINTRVVDGKEERYQFTWPDKKKSVLLANAPINKTLRPCREESVDFDNTENLYIEGDNLEVLKLLQETYLGKIKMIYIDPPYNTGNDFVYEDDFAQSTEEYLTNSGQFDEDGNRLFANTENNGRFHTDWLNMIYPRLRLAKDMLSEDGVIFISIDDNEQENLKKVCDEVFGATNYVNIISANMKNIAGASGGGEDKRLKKNCEFILIYAKNYEMLKPFGGVYAYTEMHKVVEQYRQEGKNWHYTSVLVDAGEKIFVASTVDGDGNEIKIYRRPSAVIKSVNQIMKDEDITEKEVYYKYSNGIFEAKDAQSSIRTRVTAAKKENNIRDDVVSIEYVPKTGKNKGQLYEQFYKGEKCRLFAWLKDISEVIDGVLYKKNMQGTYWDLTSYINNLSKEGNIVFPNGKKPISLIERMLKMQTNTDSMILDFFSGSATTAHAVMKLNAEDGGHRKFIMVQLPEKTDEKSEAYKAGYKNICEIGKERIRRAGAKIQKERAESIAFTKHEWNQSCYYIEHQEECDELGHLPDEYVAKLHPPIDTGLRVLKCDSSNMKEVYYTPDEYEMSLFDSLEDNIKEDRTPEDLLFQVMLDLGILLSSKIEETTISGKKVFKVDGNYLIACFDKNVTEDVITEIAKQKPYYFVMRDSSMANDSVATNFDQIFASYSPDTIRKVL